MTPYLFLLPALILLTISAFYPLLAAVGLSFTSYDFVGAIEFVGDRNYRAIWSDRLFWQVLGNTLSYLLLVVPALVTLPLGLAILVNHKLRGMALFRSIYYLPVLVSVVIAAIAWQWIYSETGLLNYALTSWFGGLVGSSVQIPWLSNPDTAILAIALVIIWRGLGYYMAIYLAGLQAIPPELYEAAAIDGSDGWR
ncbi:MAG: sugar ABC transporter permease, partial [Pseudanabaenaceae cyanobacterium bins.68]|nr:sugar ABC transporter permease [Pseudanabaenaceae cyanobacterium bins.68]